MSSASPSSGDIFDVKKLRRLADLMKEYELTELDLRQAGVRVCLRKQGHLIASDVRMAPAPAAPAAPAPAAAAPPADDKNIVTIKSEMVGTFYSASSPETPPFVNVGDHVGPETTVCIIEAMKVFTPIPAQKSGKIVAVLVENGAPVEFGHPLFKVDTRG